MIKCIGILAADAGKNGMIAGQVQDTIESGNWMRKSRRDAIKALTNIHLNKTAALIRASLKIGAALSNAGKGDISKLDNYGRYIGLAFQIVDDVLDIEGNKKLLGKKGSDRDNNKLTYPALYGLEGSKRMAADNIRKAKSELKSFGRKANVLSALANYIIERQY